MHIAQTRLSIATAPREIKEITAEVARWTERQRISVGLLTLYIPHTSAPLLIQENASPDDHPHFRAPGSDGLLWDGPFAMFFGYSLKEKPMAGQGDRLSAYAAMRSKR